MVLGIRPEDVSIAASGKGQVKAPLFSLEPTGDQTLVAAKTDAQLIIARAARDFRRELGTDISFSFAPERVHLFDGDSGQRI